MQVSAPSTSNCMALSWDSLGLKSELSSMPAFTQPFMRPSSLQSFGSSATRIRRLTMPPERLCGWTLSKLARISCSYSKPCFCQRIQHFPGLVLYTKRFLISQGCQGFHSICIHGCAGTKAPIWSQKALVCVCGAALPLQPAAPAT